MFGWAYNCLKEMIIGEYGTAAWKEIELHGGEEIYEWKDSEFYPDKDFFDMVHRVVSPPEVNCEKVLHLYGNCVLRYLRNKSFEISANIPLAPSLYDHMVNLAGLYATLGMMSFNFPVKVWCSRDDSPPDVSPNHFFLYSRVEGEAADDFSEMVEGTVQSVASQFFDTDVVFARSVTKSLDSGDVFVWEITEVPRHTKVMSADEKQALKEAHLFLEYGLSPQQLDKVFPFHIVFDSSLTIIQSGEECLKHIPSVKCGAKIAEVFDIQNSITWEEIQLKMKGEASVMDDVVNDVCLTTAFYQTPKGHSIGLKGVLAFPLAQKVAVFLCCPDVSSLETMEDLGVVMKDLSESDQTRLQKSALCETMQGMNVLNEDQATYAALNLQEALISAEDKLGTKQSFVRYVSHEIRTPLMVVDIGLSLLAKDLDDVLQLLLEEREAVNRTNTSSSLVKISQSNNTNNNDDDINNNSDGEDGGSIVSIIKNSLHTLTESKNSMSVAIGILNDLLAYEKIESGILQLHETPVRGASLFFKDTVDEFELQALEKSIKLDYVNSLPLELNDVLYLYVDQKKIQQVVRNFMSNALKFTPPNGTVTISVKVSHVGDKGTIDSYDHLTNEEAILLANSKTWNSSSDAFARNNSLTPANSRNTSELLKGAENNEAVGDQQADGGEAKSEEEGNGVARSKGTILGDKEYKHYGTVIVSFVDTGVGISKENQSKVFKSIVQFKPDELQKVSCGIVKAHGGDTGLFSAGEGEGSNFFFSLPLYISTSGGDKAVKSGEDRKVTSTTTSKEEPKAPATHEIEDLDSKMKVFAGLRVLVVDDSSMIRKMLVKMLLTLGCVVDEASDGQVAIAIIRDKLRMSFEKQDKTSDEATTMRMPYDLILMDSNMPVVSGPEATNTIVRKLGFANVVVGVTGSVLPTEVRDFLEHGATAVLAKPLMFEELADILRQNNL